MGEVKKVLGRRKTERVKLKLSTFSFFIDIGKYEDGTPCEVFVDVSKEGTFMRAALNVLSQSISLGIQNGVSVDVYIGMMADIDCEPSGTQDSVRYKSVFDAIAKELKRVKDDASGQDVG